MLTFIIVLLTIALVVDCLLLGLLVLVQLPKKEAGIGMAFGGGAADALFGAGSGTALTKLTKYTAGIFFVLVLFLSIAETHMSNSASSGLSREMENLKRDASAMPPANAPDQSTNAGVTNLSLTLPPASNSPGPATVPATNAAATNPPPAAGK